MAGDAIVGALRVVLGMDTASFEDGAKKAAHSAEGFGTKLAAVFGGVGLERIVESVFHKIAETFKETITHAFEFADQMGKMAQKVGVSVEELTGLRLAAELSDVSMEQLSVGLGKLSKQIVAAGQGGKEAKDNFAALGISVKDNNGNFKSATQVLTEMANKFEHSANGVVKVDLAMKLLGKSGKELIPLLNSGGHEIQELADAAERMGLVISTNTANQTQKFNDDLKLMKISMEGIGNIVVKELISGLSRMSGELADSAKKGDLVRATAAQIVSAIKEMTVQAIVAIETFRLFGEALSLFAESAKVGFAEVGGAVKETIFTPLGRLVDVGITKISALVQSFTAIKSAAEPLQEEFGGIADTITTVVPPANAILMKIPEILARIPGLSDAARSMLVKVFEDVEVAGKKAQGTLKAAGASPLQQELDKLALSTRVLNGDFDRLAPGLPELAARFGLIKENGAGLANSISLLSPQLLQLNDAQAKFLGAKMTQEFLDPYDVYIKKLNEINVLLGRNAINQETAGKAGIKAATEMSASYGGAFQTITSNSATAFKTLAEGNKKYAGLAKSAAIAEATVNTFVAATAALKLGPILGPIAAAVITAAGLVNVAKISATQFAQGGSFKVGGAGGIDSQLVQFKATPGEMVDVRKGEGSRSQGSTELIVPAIKPKDFFSGETVRELLIAVDQWHKDGGQGMRFAI